MNILFIAVDTLRADRLSCYGYGLPTSPVIDSLADRGVLFEEFIAPHIPTHPGFTTILSGRDVFDHHIVTQGGKTEIAEGVKLFPEILHENGYFTAAAEGLGRWFNRGFELVEHFEWDRDTAQPWRKGEAVNEAALRVLTACEQQDKPWLAWLHYWDPHTPYLPPPPFDRMFYFGDPCDPKHTSAYEMMNNYPAFQYYFNEWMPGTTDVEFPKAQYDAAIAYGDACLNHVFTYLQNMRGGEDTLVIITSDHGEELDEHEMWFDHHGLYETNLHVPLIMQHPEYFSGGRGVKGMTVHQDLAPTILEAVGLKQAAADAQMQGESLLALVESGSDAGTRESVYIAECAWMKKRGLRTRRFKFFESLYDELHKRPPFELYDIQSDPMEQHNLADEEPERLQSFQADLASFVEQRLRETGGPDPIMEQSITMTHVGNVDVAVPDDQVLEEDD